MSYNKEQIKLKAIDKIIRMDDDWGYGQMSIARIIEQNYNNDDFCFVKTVSAGDDDWQECTITADNDCFFVYPIRRILLIGEKNA